MDIKEALGAISDGHTVYSLAYAHKVCGVFGAPFINGTPMYSDPPGTHKGLTMKEGAEGEVCVAGLALGDHIVHYFGLESKVTAFFGRGSQAREHARVVREHLDECEVVRKHLQTCPRSHDPE